MSFSTSPATIVKASAPPPASRLSSLIDSAGRAFVNHDYGLSQALVDSAFAILHRPSTVPDALDEYRLRWDVFRITLEAQVYTTTTALTDLPPYLKDITLQSSHALITTMYERSLNLFTPTNGSSKIHSARNVVFVPPPVLTTLAYASLKVNCPDVGRIVIEEWFARREVYPYPTRNEAYKKLLAIYCLQILPALDQWEYAKEFLEYECELSPKARQYLQKSFHDAYSKAKTTRAPSSSSSTPTPGTPVPRSFSPAPSHSSSSSSLSTTSTHTVVPATPRGSQTPRSLSKLATASQSTESLSSTGTAKPHEASAENVTTGPKRRPTARSPTSYSSFSGAIPNGSLPLSVPATINSPTQRSPGLLALLRASCGPIFNSTKMATFLIIAIVFPLISLVVRLRQRRGGGSTSTVDMVRKRLQAVNGPEAGVLRRIWGEAVRVLLDTARMGGSGLV